MTSKTCTACGEDKPLSAYYTKRHRSGNVGYFSECRKCKNRIRNEYRKKQRGHIQQMGTQVKDGHRLLAAAAIHQAVKDWKCHPSLALKQFFTSDWFELLVDYLELDPDVIRERLGVSV